uniref:UDP-glucuronosyltransferase n=1 Tax=Pristionchus pacificus TaxID=54126 RepID=A0A8R1UWT3_PRIPA
MRAFVPILFTSLFVHTGALKFLAYNPQFGKSHVNFFSKLADALVDAGHEVVMLSPRTDVFVGAPKTKARVIEVDQCAYTAAFMNQMASEEGTMAGVWKSTNVFKQLITAFRPLFKAYNHQCNATLSNTALMQRLRDEKFDAGFAENIDNCGYAIFYQLGIKKYATAFSMAFMDGYYLVTQTPASTAYVPSLYGGMYGDRMTFMQRLYNTLVHLTADHLLLEHDMDRFQEIAVSVGRISETSCLLHRLVFLNSDPLIDFPKLTSARVIDIGGIVVHDGYKKLDENWSTILSLRNHTIFISFGTWVKGHLMPQEYKETIRRTIKNFPDVTFIWKYEKPEDNISDGLDNVVETTWAPQTDLLHDGRLTAFITHGGQGSITEAANAGVPLICIPVTCDQLRNGRAVERNGVGIMIEKDALASEKPLEDAISAILNENRFHLSAKKMAQMIEDRPFAMKEVFVRNMEFLAKYGPLNQLQHYGSKLSLIEYYLIDVFAFIVLSVFVIIFAIMFTGVKLLSTLINFVSIRKLKTQ